MGNVVCDLLHTDKTFQGETFAVFTLGYQNLTIDIFVRPIDSLQQTSLAHNMTNTLFSFGYIPFLSTEHMALAPEIFECEVAISKSRRAIY